jgi:glucose-1-phosphate thymidylyltransferase
MKVIIPVAGVGSRLRPHTYTTPKVLLHVAGRPILSHVLEPILKLNPEEVVFVIGFRGEDIREFIESNYQFKASFVKQENLLGLGYAVSLAMNFIQEGPVLVVLGDTIVECDLEKFTGSGDYVLGVRQVDDPRRFGIAETEDGFVVRLEEKPIAPKTDLAVIGLYYFRDSRPLKAALDQHMASGRTTRGEVQFTDALQAMVESGIQFRPYEVTDWFDCGKKETILETNRHLLKRIGSPSKVAGSTIVQPVFIGEGAVVQHSVIGPNVSLSEGAIVENCILRDTIIGPHAHVDHVVLENSLIGHHVIIKGSARTLNIGDSSEMIVT